METSEAKKKVAKRAKTKGNGATEPQPEKRRGGRPTKFTPERRQKIIEALKTGASYKAVAHYARMSYDCLRDWIIEGSETTDEGDEYFQFFQDVNEALGSLQVRSLASIQKTGLGGVVVSEKTVLRRDGTEEVTKTYAQPQWLALAWIMQHRFAGEWSDGSGEAAKEIPESAPRPLATLKRETIDIYDPDRLARLIGAFAEAGLVPEEIVGRFALPNPSKA